jgi:hypothetical protein
VQIKLGREISRPFAFKGRENERQKSENFVRVFVKVSGKHNDNIQGRRDIGRAPGHQI